MDLSKLVITTDCAGSIGEKKNDQVKVTTEILSHFTTRNAIIENLSKGGTPHTIVYANFIGDHALPEILSGIDSVLKDQYKEIQLIGSTESNFEMSESALSITVIGEQTQKQESRYTNYCVIGLPLVGEEVLNNQEHIVSLEEIRVLLNNDTVSRIIPIGSKGINHRSQTVFNKTFHSTQLDLNKSAGPSTAVLVEYDDFTQLQNGITTIITKLELQ